jgi:hypothetical protein
MGVVDTKRYRKAMYGAAVHGRIMKAIILLKDRSVEEEYNENK